MSDALLDWILGVATFFVIAGVALEGAEYVEEVLEKGWQFANPWKFAQKLGFTILVVGLAGEWYSSTIVHRRDAERIVALTHEAKTAEGKIAEDNKIANKAASDAAQLHVSVGTLHDFVREQTQENNAAIGELKANTVDLRKARADALTAAQEAKKDLADIAAALNQERQLRDKYAKQVEPRQISDADIDRVALKLEKFSGQSWTVTTFWDLKEPLAFANRLAAVLNRAHWVCDNSGSKSFLLGGVAGVFVYVHPKASEKTRAAANALVKALTDANFDAQERQINDPNDSEKDAHDKISINVGTKN